VALRVKGKEIDPVSYKGFLTGAVGTARRTFKKKGRKSLERGEKIVS